MVKSLKIITYPNPNLRLKGRPLTQEEIISPETKQFVNELSKKMLKEDGLGLAATQVDRQFRVFVINTPDGVQEFINPEITYRSWLKEKGEEGCLSVPGIFDYVKRHRKIKIKYFNLLGEQKILKARKMLARVIQHEYDHLDGILFIDKLAKK